MATLTQIDPDVEDGVEYPKSDGKPMAESEIHLLIMVEVIQMLRNHFGFAAGFLMIPVTDADKKRNLSRRSKARRSRWARKIIVEMEVKAAKNALEKRGEIYLDSHENFRDDANFAVVITKKGAESLKAAGIDDPADHYKGKTIKAKGTVSEVDGIPRIEIDDAKQIEIPEKK